MDIGVLFLGGAKRVSFARRLMRAAGELGHTLRIFSYEIEKDVPISEVGEVIVGLRCGDPAIISHLEETVYKHDIRIVLPFIDPAVEIASRLSEICPGLFIPVSSPELCRKMFDKVEADRLFRLHGIPVPRRFMPGEHYPQIWKPRTGSASQGIIVVKRSSELPVEDSDKYLIQEYIVDAKEYTVDCYIGADGKILSVVPRLRLATAGGEVTKTVTVSDTDLITLSEKVLSSLKFRGAVTLQFLRDSDGRTLLMEVNPRLGGGVVASIAAGSRVPEMILKEALGIPVSRVTDWKPDTFISRYMQEVVFHNFNLNT